MVDSISGQVPLIRSNSPSAFRATVIPLHLFERIAAERESGILGESIEEIQDGVDSYTKALRALESSRRQSAEVAG
ncbi:hypothetical protein ALI22I_11955 [Saccharothrix sp. ALI-22-I]|uniref:hypothetical protein n=1 Tax=Saccharothrix sp. ALI-22-I TaxID=1933778 RepID=UPI00097C1FAD|nr:hypothetical protein [Saccharothrix sp. ALI-22-I]ONI90450.1 hypothetical protein ALI22I_11955 [Saccharothrix sp. ALI-22-I]